MATVDVVEPPAFHRQAEIEAMTRKAMQGESPRLTKAEKAEARAAGQKRWKQVRPHYEKKWKGIAEDITRPDVEDVDGEDMPADLLNKLKGIQ